jgi:hypothetical protein
VIFEHIVRGKVSSPTALKDDVALLSATVSYFAEMRSQMRLLATVCTRLQHTASVFLQLAQNHVSRRPPEEPARKKAKSPVSSLQNCSDLVDIDIRDINVANYLEWLPGDLATAAPTRDVDGHWPHSFGASQRRRMSGNMFDWFSWDTYYAGADI